MASIVFGVVLLGVGVAFISEDVTVALLLIIVGLIIFGMYYAK